MLILLPELADCGVDQLRDAVGALADLRGTIELARASGAPIDIALFDEALARLQARPLAPMLAGAVMALLAPMLAGAVMAFVLIDGQAEAGVLAARLRGELASGYVDPAERLAFLGGVIAVARELLWTVPEIVATLDALVAGLDEEGFLALLPHLRLALMPLDPREIDRLAEEVAVRIGAQPGAARHGGRDLRGRSRRQSRTRSRAGARAGAGRSGVTDPVLLRRWRLALGRYAERSLSAEGMTGAERRADRALDYLYAREMEKRGLRRDKSTRGRQGSLGSQPAHPAWLARRAARSLPAIGVRDRAGARDR